MRFWADDADGSVMPGDAARAPVIDGQLVRVRTALFVPADNARALAKAATLGADLVIVDLEDAVVDERKEAARAAADRALRAGFGGALRAVRINAAGTAAHGADLVFARDSAAEIVVMPKVEDARRFHDLQLFMIKPMLAMIETPTGVLDVRGIAANAAGLIAGTNDLATTLGLPPSAARDGLRTALQLIVLAARERRIAALDGVCNDLDNVDAVAREAQEARSWGFTGKTLIHPSQLAPTRAAFAPSAAEVDEARRLLATTRGGAQRFEGRQIEDMHVVQARALLAEAERHTAT